MSHISKLILVNLSAAFSICLGAVADVTVNPHDIRGQQPETYCLACHLQLPKTLQHQSSGGRLPDQSDFQSDADGVSMCVNCHDADKASHETGGDSIDFTVPADLPLSSDRKLTCLTCHYMHGSLASDRPWASVSILDRLLDHERMHKNYLLRRNNSDGELCLVCHDSNQH